MKSKMADLKRQLLSVVHHMALSFKTKDVEEIVLNVSYVSWSVMALTLRVDLKSTAPPQRSKKTLKYSGTPLIRPPSGHGKLVVLLKQTMVNSTFALRQ